MKNIVKHNQVQGKCSQTGIFPATEEAFNVYPISGFNDAVHLSGFNDAVHSEALRSSIGLGIRSVVEKEDFKGIVQKIEQASETRCDCSRNSFLKKLDAFSTWVLRKLLPKSLTSCPPPDRQIYY
jgi:hypothetical protein